jgi:hypothetical protein
LYRADRSARKGSASKPAMSGGKNPTPKAGLGLFSDS